MHLVSYPRMTVCVVFTQLGAMSATPRSSLDIHSNPLHRGRTAPYPVFNVLPVIYEQVTGYFWRISQLYFQSMYDFIICNLYNQLSTHIPICEQEGEGDYSPERIVEKQLLKLFFTQLQHRVNQTSCWHENPMLIFQDSPLLLTYL